MKVALVSEGTYPFAMGGVSVWCDQLIRGLRQHEIEFVALTVDARSKPLWPAPDNLALRLLPLWTPERPRRRGISRAGAHAVDQLVRELVRPRPRDDVAARRQVDVFLHSLHAIALEAQRRGGTSGLLSNDRAVSALCTAWAAAAGSSLTLREALELADLVEHLLRPLGVEPVTADVVHAAMNGPSMLVGMLAKWLHGTPVVLSEHGIYLRERYLLDEAPHLGRRVAFLRLNFFRLLAAGSYQMADALAPHSLYNRRWQLVNGADVSRMYTMYNGVSVTDFPFADTEPEQPTISFLGRIDPVKDVRNLIEAFARVRASLPQARLRMFGGAPLGQEEYLEACQRLIDDLGLTGAATLEGHVQDPVHGYHAGSVVALSSISEGFPFSIVEAMACGRPVVCTNVGGVAEAVGDAGLVVPPKDPDALGAALTRLLVDGGLRAEMGARARERVVDFFTVQRWVETYDSLYRAVAAGPERTTLFPPEVRPVPVEPVRLLAGATS